ncbi:hypothetical protein EON81_22385 [bacterium]|nr:MAG: hypothetical protein EON81_22385 [bacterium]
MDRGTAAGGGFIAILEELVSVPSTAGGDTIFDGAPTGTVGATFTLRDGTATLTFTGMTPTAGGVGLDYEAGTYELPLAKDQLAKIRAIAPSALPGFVTYWKLA